MSLSGLNFAFVWLVHFPHLYFHPSNQPASQSSNQSAHSNYFSPTQGKLLPYRLAVLLRHSWDKFPTTLLFLLLRGIGISMAIKADLVLSLFSHTPFLRPYQWSYITAVHGTCPRGAEVNNGQRYHAMCLTSKTLRDDEVMQMCSSRHFIVAWPFWVCRYFRAPW